MPELPEVETIKKYLNKTVSGKKIVSIKILSKKQFPSQSKKVIGKRILSVERRAKNLIFKLSDSQALLVHLKMSGQLIWAKKKDQPTKSTRVIISFDKNRLFFNDMRKFGWIKVLNKDQLDLELARFGPEPLTKNFSDNYLGKTLGQTRRAIKIILLDQTKIAGIGNIYANEILARAQIDPQKPANRLKAQEIKKLRKAIQLVLKEGIKYNGSSAADQLYLRPDSSSGSYQQYFRVYQKDGQKCHKCKAAIKRINLGGRGTFFCPKCQV